MEELRLEGTLCIPGSVRDLDTFRLWATSDEIPEKLRISYFNGDIVVEYCLGALAHNKAKTGVLFGLQRIPHIDEQGELLSDGMRLTHPEAELSSEPDGIYYSREALERQRVQLLQGGESKEIVGSPEMVLEVVSTSSVTKDKVVLRQLYWKAGIDEYWLVDPRNKGLTFDILRWTAKGYVSARKKGGWIPSVVFAREFRLLRSDNSVSMPVFTLESR